MLTKSVNVPFGKWITEQVGPCRSDHWNRCLHPLLDPVIRSTQGINFCLKTTCTAVPVTPKRGNPGKR